MKQFVCLTGLLALVLTGCNSNPSGNFNVDARRITILTEPAGATVTQINPMGQGTSNLGKTPITDRSIMIVTKVKMKNMPYHQAQQLVEQVNNLVVRIEKEGYQPYYGNLRTASDETIAHTIRLTPVEKAEQ